MTDEQHAHYPSLAEITARMVRAMQDGQYREALPLLNTLIARDPADGALLFSRGLAHYQLQQYRQAADDFTRAEASGLADGDLLLMRARAQALLGQADAALRDLDTAIARAASAALYQTRAAVYEALGQARPAFDDYSAAIALAPASGELYYRRALLQTGADALRDFTSALAQGYGRPEVYRMRGLTFEALGQWDAALDDYAQAIALDRRSAAAYQTRAELLLRLERFAEALADLDRALRLAPDRADLLVSRGQALLLRGHDGDALRARQDFAAVLKRDPAHGQALCGRGLAYARLGRFDRAAADFLAFVSEDSVQGDEERAGAAWLILMLAQQADWDEAAAQIRLMRERYPELADAALVASQEGWTAAQQALYEQAWKRAGIY